MRRNEDELIMNFLVLCAVILILSLLNYWNSFSEAKRVEHIVVREYVESQNEGVNQPQNEEVIVSENCQLLSLPPQTKGGVKTYMDYRKITNTTSAQYKLQQTAYTDEHGYRRLGENYIIALGSAYGTNIGDKYYITLANGLTFPAVLGDCKADIHTDVTNRYVESNGNIVEYIVDTKKINQLAKTMGDVSYGGFHGEIVQILKVESEKNND